MFYENAFGRNKEFIIFVDEQDFEAHYNYEEECVKNKYFLSHTCLPTTFPCAYEIIECICKRKGSHSNNYNEYLKPCSLYYAYYECTINLQQTITNLQKSLDNVNARFSAFSKIGEDE